MTAATFHRIGGPIRMLARTVRVTRLRIPFRAVLHQIREIGVGSVWLVCSGMAFFGAVMVTIADAQARKFTGSLAVIGPAYFELLVREFGPFTSALLAAARAGARDASELAWMSVNEQVEALEMSAGDPLRDLVAPRVTAGLISIPALCVLGTVAAIASAAATAQFVFDSTGSAFVDARYVDMTDVASALLKTILCGVWIPLAASWRGLAARGGALDVGKATTDGVVMAVLGCLIIDLLVALIFLLLQA